MNETAPGSGAVRFFTQAPTVHPHPGRAPDAGSSECHNSLVLQVTFHF